MPKDSKYGTFNTLVDIARYYGFSSLRNFLSSLKGNSRHRKPHISLPKEGLAGEANRPGLMKAYLDYGGEALPQPVMIYHTEPLRKYMPRSEYGGKEAVLFALEIIGTEKSIAEALLLKMALTMLHELGFTDNISVEINSLGDRESIARFSREFTNYYRRRAEEVPAHCRNNLKKDIFKVLQCAEDKCMLFKEKAPKPVSALTEPSREHFAEVLEYLESMNMTYTMNHCLVGGKDYYTKTIFEIKSENGVNEFFPRKKFDATLARGGRFDDLVKILGHRKEVPSVGITLTLGGLGIIPPKRQAAEKIKKPKVYLVHLGFDAKLKSLSAIEILRKAKIPIYQALSKDRFSAQIAVAERIGVPFMVIIGQKEAYDGTAIVRNMINRSQETVPLKDLPHYLKSPEKV